MPAVEQRVDQHRRAHRTARSRRPRGSLRPGCRPPPPRRSPRPCPSTHLLRASCHGAYDVRGPRQVGSGIDQTAPSMSTWTAPPDEQALRIRPSGAGCAFHSVPSCQHSRLPRGRAATKTGQIAARARRPGRSAGRPRQRIFGEIERGHVDGGTAEQPAEGQREHLVDHRPALEVARHPGVPAQLTGAHGAQRVRRRREVDPTPLAVGPARGTRRAACPESPSGAGDHERLLLVERERERRGGVGPDDEIGGLAAVRRGSPPHAGRHAAATTLLEVEPRAPAPRARRAPARPTSRPRRRASAARTCCRRRYADHR